MKKYILASLSVLLGAPAFAQKADILEFFKEQTWIVSGSRQPQAPQKVPATVYVVTGQQIRESGAQTLWEALRGLPGVDVITVKAFHGDVGIRGMNKTSNNRTLVLLDGKTVQNGYFGSIVWETIPVTLDEIDRIEVVEGPASALYGANAISGAINIITKTPQQIKNGMASYWGGQRNTHFASGLVGGEKSPVDFKLGVGYRRGNAFEDSDLLSDEVTKAHTRIGMRLGEDSSAAISAGVADHNTQVATARASFDDGVTHFMRGDYNFCKANFRAYWNRGRSFLREHPYRIGLDYDTVDFEGDYTLNLPAQNQLTFGGEYRRNNAYSNLFAQDQSQDLWAAFFDDVWSVSQSWTVSASGRMDKHPLTHFVFSPRGSVIYSPRANQTFRFSAGTSFRTPTLLENYISLTTVTAVNNPPYTQLETTILPNLDLDPESFVFQELAHQATYGRIKFSLAGFHYLLSDEIAGTSQDVQSPAPVQRRNTMVVNQGQTEAWGGEVGGEAPLHRMLAGFFSYSYQSLRDENVLAPIAPTAPRNKVSGGLRFHAGGASAYFAAHWVDETFWQTAMVRAEPYVLMNARVAYAFAGKLQGLEIGVSGYNIADNVHQEVPPSVYGIPAGDAAREGVRSRWMGTVSYSF